MRAGLTLPAGKAGKEIKEDEIFHFLFEKRKWSKEDQRVGWVERSKTQQSERAELPQGLGKI